MQMLCFSRQMNSLFVYFLSVFFISLIGTINEVIAFNRDSTTIDSLLNISWQEKDNNYEKALSLAKSALGISKKNNDNNRTSKAYNFIGIIYRNKGKLELAESYFFRSKEIRESIGDRIGIAGVLNNLGTLEKMRGNYEKSLQYLYDASKIYELEGKPLLLANSYLNIANTFQKENGLNSAIEYHRKSYKLYLEFGDSLNIADANYSLAADYLLSDQMDSAQHYALKALDYFYELGYWDGETDAIDILAQVSIEKKDYEKAQELYQTSIELYETHGDMDDPRLFLLYLNRGGLFIEMKKGSQALSDLRKAKFLLADRNEPDNRLRLARGFTDVFEMSGQLDSALFMNREAFDWLDTIEAKSRAEAIAEMQTKYESEKTERELAEEKLVSQAEKTQKNIFLALALAVIGIAIFGYFYFHQKQKTAAIISKQQTRIHQQEVEELLKTQELTAINSMLEGQENERIRIAKDLHDRLGSMLTTVKWSFDGYLENRPDNGEVEPLAKASNMLDDAYQEVRRIAHNMVSGVLTKFGLVPALQELARTVSAGGKMNVKIISTGLDDRLDSKIEIAIYRIIQELLSNVLKHAYASETNIQLTRIEGGLNISVEDNGMGFDPKSVKHGMGIKNIEARVQAMDGSFFIDTGKGSGTTVMIDLPG